LMNLVGGVLLIINSAYKEAYPFTFINTVWVLIAIPAIFRAIIKMRTVEV
jgi:hypothetical protein